MTYSRSTHFPSVFLSPDAVQTNTGKLMGRQSAGRGFMRSLSKAYQGDSRPLKLVHGGGAQQSVLEAEARATGWNGVINHCRIQDPASWSKGVMYYPAPFNSRMGWQRHRCGEASMAFCGVTHTLSSSGVLGQIADYAYGPFTAADALVCTSQSVLKVVHQIWEQQCNWFEYRLKAKVTPSFPMTPVIPLGVHTQDYVPDADLRKKGRDRWGLDNDEFAVLFVGRLSFHSKANPLPMYLAVARAAAISGRRLRVLECGWFANEGTRHTFDEAAQLAGVNVTRMDGREDGVTRLAYASADVFISLSDNIQETFGLTPLEAMSAGLPVIVSDWDGYRETVRDGVDGFLIPTLQITDRQASKASSEAYEDGRINYDHYIAHAHLWVAADIQACAQALLRLVTNEALRRSMGESGRKHAVQQYDWSVVMRQYQSLWMEQISRLVSMKNAGNFSSYRATSFINPLDLFDHYPSVGLHGKTFLWRSANYVGPSLRQMRGMRMWNFANDRLSPIEALEKALLVLPDGLEFAPTIEAWAIRQGWSVSTGLRNAAWLVKIGLVQSNTFSDGLCRKTS